MPNQTMPILSALLTCLCQQLITDERPVCDCCLVASEELPPMTGCDCVCEGAQGTAWARLVSGAWQQPAVTKCPTGPWQVTFQIGVYRCVSSEPTCETKTAEATALANDAASLARAVLCCDALAGRNHTLGGLQIIGPLGGCIGVALDVAVELGSL